MLSKIQNHYIDKSQVVYVSPVHMLRDWHALEIGGYFTAMLKNGNSISFHHTEFADNLEEWKKLRDVRLIPLIDETERLREKLL